MASLDRDQVNRAVKSLLKYVQAKKDAQSKISLLDDGENISLILSLVKIPDKPSNKPIHIPIPNTLFDENSTEMCLFVKESDAKDVKAKLEAEPVDGLKKVIGLNKLRKNYAQYKQRRELLSSYDVFLTDDRILPMLPKAIGKKFFVAKKQPIPIKVIGRRNLKKQVERARNATYLYLGWGACSSVRIGLTNMEHEAIVDNIMGAMETISLKIPRKMKGIQAIHIKTSNSIALPIYNSLPFDTSSIDTSVEEEQKVLDKPVAVSMPSKKKRKASTSNKQVKKSKTGKKNRASKVSA
eukprot:GSMAST32.ASY1.ANO1.1280.1 assembled CDS